MINTFFYKTILGTITISEKDNFITQISYGKKLIKNSVIFESRLLKKASKQLVQYFEGERKRFELPLKPQGTEFQMKVWKALSEIPYGETRSYKDIAIKIGNEKASRAVGMANNKNTIAIVVPCHRVIGANGDLVGYASGLNIKQQLLEIERKNNL